MQKKPSELGSIYLLPSNGNTDIGDKGITEESIPFRKADNELLRNDNLRSYSYLLSFIEPNRTSMDHTRE